MTLVAVGMVKDEADVIEGVLRHLISEGVDRIIVLDNGSSDGTSELILETAASTGTEITRIVDDEVGYYQSRKVSAACEALVEPGSWVVPFDADELWHAGLSSLREFFGALGPDVDIVNAGLLSHFATGADFTDLTDVFYRFEWRHPEVAPLPKLALRWRAGAKIGQGAHNVILGDRVKPIIRRPGPGNGLTVRHFPYRSVDQFVRKVRNGVAAYLAAPDLPEGMGAHWRAYGAILDAQGVEGIEQVMVEHYVFEDPIASGMVHDPAPYRRWEL